MPNSDKGFGSMDPETLKKVTSKGGKTTASLGKLYKFDQSSGSLAGKKSRILQKIRREQLNVRQQKNRILEEIIYL